MKIKLFILLNLLFHSNLTQKTLSQNNESNLFLGSKDHVFRNGILKSFYRFSMVNDFNPLLGQGSNDEGYTAGLFHELRFLDKRRGRFYDVALTSQLYTEYQLSSKYRIDGRKIIPQKFTEINALRFSVNQSIGRINTFVGLELGIGLRNKEKPLNGFTLMAQSGSDGLGGFHSWLKNHHGVENIQTGGIIPFAYFSPFIFKYFNLRTKQVLKDPAFLQLKTGLSIGAFQKKSEFFVQYYSEWPLLQFVSQRNKKLKFSVLFEGTAMAHASGFSFKPEFGFEIYVHFLALGYSSIFNFGSEQIDVINYFDKESLMKAYLKFIF